MPSSTWIVLIPIMLRPAGPIPAELGKGSRIWMLDLSDNKLEGKRLVEILCVRSTPLIRSFLGALYHRDVTILARTNNQVCRPQWLARTRDLPCVYALLLVAKVLHLFDLRNDCTALSMLQARFHNRSEVSRSWYICG